MSALVVNIIIVHPWDVVFPRAKALGWTIMMFTLSAGNNCIMSSINPLCYNSSSLQKFYTTISVLFLQSYGTLKKIGLSSHVCDNSNLLWPNFVKLYTALGLIEVWYLSIFDIFYFYGCRFMGSFGNMKIFFYNFRSNNDFSNLYFHSLRVNYFMMKLIRQSLKKVRWIWPWREQELTTKVLMTKVLMSKDRFFNRNLSLA